MDNDSSDGDDIDELSDNSSPSVVRGSKGWWRASVPPEESISDVDEGREWRYQIIGEEVDGFGKVWYEANKVRWDDWSRVDGTKTTWEDGSTLSTTSWDKSQRRIRREKAAMSLEIDVLHTTDIHNTLTYFREQAGYEKAKRLRAEPESNFLEEMNRNLIRHQVNLPATYTSRTQRSSTRQKTGISLANSSSSALLRSRSNQSSVASIGSGAEKPPPSFRSTPASSSHSGRLSPSLTHCLDSSESLAMHLPMKRSRKRVESPDSDAAVGPSIRSSHKVASSSASQSRPSKTPAIGRMQLQHLWTSKAKQWSAASISFRNDIDDEAIPSISPNFCYLEASYQFAHGVRKPSDEFLVTCSCHECLDASVCGCQDASEIMDGHGNRMFAYTRTGFFKFNIPPGTEVIECNKLCSCSLDTCRNRISQRPRDIPIEIFKSSQRGWGVRPLIDVKFGKVVGLYTGLVIKREAACGSLTSYCFDLDGDEGEGRELSHKKYTVDSRLHGNWTRFINHSCSPNLVIYLVVHDIPPSTGMPFIVFVASCDITAGTEFTFDYNPKRSLERRKKKGKRPEEIPEGAIPCLCGSSECRGYL